MLPLTLFTVLLLSRSRMKRGARLSLPPLPLNTRTGSTPNARAVARADSAADRQTAHSCCALGITGITGAGAAAGVGVCTAACRSLG